MSGPKPVEAPLAGGPVVRGGSGPDLVTLTTATTYKARGGDDRVTGSSEGDRLLGQGGADGLYGREGDDVAAGGSGADTIRGDAGDDTLKGGGGGDAIWGDDLFGTVAGDDVMDGQGGDDLLFGRGGNDRIKGGAGDDVLAGEAGKDRLFGGKGADEINPGAGRDQMWGGKGADLFHFNEDAGRKNFVKDWEDGRDRIGVDVGDGVGFAELKIRQKGDDVHVVMGDGGVRAVVKDADAGDFTIADFTFFDEPG